MVSLDVDFSRLVGARCIEVVSSPRFTDVGLLTEVSSKLVHHPCGVASAKKSSGTGMTFRASWAGWWSEGRADKMVLDGVTIRPRYPQICLPTIPDDRLHHTGQFVVDERED